jgi:adenylosuccinate synthase
VSRRGIRLGELMDRERFTERLREVMEYHNFALQHYFKSDTVDYRQVLDESLAQADPGADDRGCHRHPAPATAGRART